MIRKYETSDLDRIIDIWLTTSIKCHSFIEHEFWQSKVDAMRNIYIPASETCVYQENSIIKGFASLNGNVLAAIFVSPEFQHSGIGSKLIDYVISLRKNLTLTVYCENKKSIAFYLKNNFTIIKEQTDPHTGHPEYLLQHNPLHLSIEKMKIEELPAVIDVWESSVRSSHTFLPEDDIIFYKNVIQEYFSSGDLFVAKNKCGDIIAFYSVDGNMLDTLFVSSDYFRQGVGTFLLNDAIARFTISTVDVNQQNASAVAFYQRHGFDVAGCRETDDFGKPYPILKMIRK